MPAKASFSVKAPISDLQPQERRDDGGRGLGALETRLFDEEPVTELEHTVGARGDARIVRGEHDGLTLAHEPAQGATTSRAFSLSRLPVGSSASRSRGRFTSARAEGDTLLLPAGEA